MAEYTVQPEGEETTVSAEISNGSVDLEPSNHFENGGRDSVTGRFVKGNRGGPGRPTAKEEEALVKTLNAKFPPEYVAEKLQEALDLASLQKSPRGIVAALTFVENYRTGTPIKRVVKETTGYDKLRALLDKAEAESGG